MEEWKEEEVWKEVHGWSDYKISTMGRVMSYKWGKERLLECNPNKDGYRLVQLHNNGKRKTIAVHRQMGLTFLPNFYGLPEVDHKDKNRQNNSLYNLHWVTKSEQNINKTNYRTDITATDPKERVRIARQQREAKVKASGQWECVECDVSFANEWSLLRHESGPRHTKKLADYLTIEDSGSTK